MKTVYNWLCLSIFLFICCNKQSNFDREECIVYISDDFSASMVYNNNSVKVFTPYGVKTSSISQLRTGAIENFIDDEELFYRINGDSAYISILTYSKALSINENWREITSWDSIVVRMISNEETNTIISSIVVKKDNHVDLEGRYIELKNCTSRKKKLRMQSSKVDDLLEELNRIDYSTFKLITVNDSDKLSYLQIQKFHNGDSVLNLIGDEIPLIYDDLNRLITDPELYISCL